jgi:hypothetical protein
MLSAKYNQVKKRYKAQGGPVVKADFNNRQAQGHGGKNFIRLRRNFA